MERKLYTIGYATKDIDDFVCLLRKYGVTSLIDVRTSPYSKAFLEYDKHKLKEVLNKHGILYAHFGEEFGARRSEREAYSITYSYKDGKRMEQVDFQHVYQLPSFQKGISRVKKAIL